MLKHNCHHVMAIILLLLL